MFRMGKQFHYRPNKVNLETKTEQNVYMRAIIKNYSTNVLTIPIIIFYLDELVFIKIIPKLL